MTTIMGATVVGPPNPGERYPTANYRVRCIAPRCPKGPCIPCMCMDLMQCRLVVFGYEARDAKCAVDLADGSQTLISCKLIVEHWSGSAWVPVEEGRP